VATTVQEPVPKRIGRYDLVRHLATGGMAEIYVARLAGIGGFQRHVTLKTIRPERVEDQAFVHMFLDEARLVAGLHHHNVCQVHDVGLDNGTYYLALEYIHGESARAILERARDLNVTIPLEISLAIIAGAAAGLHHAHESRALDGTQLALVHRDVSPSNILVGYDGSVKLIDFGIARAAVGRHAETQTGMIKGKFGYMSPEQCRGWPVDRRSDVFGAGIVLYELTTQTRAFRAENDYETMQRIVRGDVLRPSRVSSGYPLDLELVVLRALSVDPDARFPTAAAMLEMIERCARRVGGLASPATVGRFLTDLFGPRPEPWREDEDEKTHDGSIEDIELVEAFDGPSAMGMFAMPVDRSAEPTAARAPSASSSSGVSASVEADIVTVTASMPLPGMPTPMRVRMDQLEAATEDGRPRGRLAAGTQPLPYNGDLPPLPPGAIPGCAPHWDLPPSDLSGPHLGGALSTGTRRAATEYVTPLHAALTTFLRMRWTWVAIGGGLGILLGVIVGVAMGGDDPPAAPAGAVVQSLVQPSTPSPPSLTPEIGQAVVLVDAGVAAPGDDAPVLPPVSADRVLVRITSEPSKATVLLDGKRLGKTPFIGALRKETGKAEIKIRRRGFKTVRADVDRSVDVRLHVELPEQR
jgi:serine/threonine protein kinase